MFDIAIATFYNITTAFKKVQVKRDISFDDAFKSVLRFNVIIVASRLREAVNATIVKSNKMKMLNLISTFTE
jgi:hypothetical protein